MAGRYNLTSLKQERAGCNRQKQAEKLCKEIAWLRAGKCCEFCGKLSKEVHHVFFGRQWYNFWPARTNPAFFVNLCANEHKYAGYAPHVDNERFLRRLSVVLWDKDPDRINEIQDFINLHPTDPGPAPWDTIICKLKKRRDYLISTMWMDDFD
jgi:hypothetical protein